MSGRFDFWTVSACSDPGRVRENNEDSYGVLLDDGCFFVADGMGGGEAGELASDYVRAAVSDGISGTALDSPGLRKYNVQQAIHKANQLVRQYAEEHNYRLMGSTLALCLLDPWRPGVVHACHVGDSRIYCLHDGELFRITRDHTVGEEMARGGAKAKEFRGVDSKRKTAMSHVLTRAIGTSGMAAPEWNEFAVSQGDRVLVCSDGITTMLDDKAIEKILKAGGTEECMESLKAAVLEAGALDNLTIVMADVKEPVPPDEEHDEDERQESDYLMMVAESRTDG